MNKCPYRRHVINLGQQSEKLTLELKEHITSCDMCHDAYIKELKNNNILRKVFLEWFGTLHDIKASSEERM